jgi:hypothetical protein
VETYIFFGLGTLLLAGAVALLVLAVIMLKEYKIWK